MQHERAVEPTTVSRHTTGSSQTAGSCNGQANSNWQANSDGLANSNQTSSGHERGKPRTILIAGPTASGKSALALGIAERIGGTIINADSMQVYRDLRIITARPDAKDEARVPHRLYGHVPLQQAYSAAQFATDAAPALAEAWAEGRVPIVVGGTGLYFRALTDGLSPIPPVPAAIRALWRAEAVRLGAPALHAALAVRDPETAARLRPTDSQRIVRALEVLDATGRGLASWHGEAGRAVLDAHDAVRLVVAPDRAALMARAEARLARMLADGAIEEAGRLAALGLSPDLPVMRALGVAEMIRAWRGEITVGEAAELTLVDTRHYIKRQLTWLKRNMIAWNWLDEQQTEKIANGDFTLISRSASSRQ